MGWHFYMSARLFENSLYVHNIFFKEYCFSDTNT